MENIILKTGKEHMQMPLIHQYLTNYSYWAKGISYEWVDHSFSNSFCLGAFIGDRQVGFARMITDQYTFGWLADVFVLPEYRGQGISKKMVMQILEQPFAQRLRRIMLNTADAHGLYQQFNFTKADHPANLMEIVRPDIHLQFKKQQDESSENA